MYRWYKNSQICYIYLSDVEKTPNLLDMGGRIAESRWFTRGWTLQELLGPRRACFYTQDWRKLGTKAQLVDLISSITGIDKSYLDGKDLRDASIAQRMSWASSRNTSRTEDIAYCLLGIFDINLPLMYGEGHKAFQRLQVAIMQDYPEDHSLFAWGTIVEAPALEILSNDDLMAYKTLEWKAPAQRLENDQLSGLLASSPRDFRDSHSVVPSDAANHFYRRPEVRASIPMRVGNGIIRLELPLLPWATPVKHHWDNPNFAQERAARFAFLLCHQKDSKNYYMVLTIIECDNNLYSRTRSIALSYGNNIGPFPIFDWRGEVFIGVERFKLQHQDIIFRRLSMEPGFSCIRRPHYLGQCNFNYSVRAFRGTNNQRTRFAFEFRQIIPKGRPLGFCICLTREPEPDNAPIMLGLIPFSAILGFAQVDESRKDRSWPFPRAVFAARHENVEVMQSPIDHWSAPLQSPFHEAYVGIERVPLGSDGSYIDLVDLIVR